MPQNFACLVINLDGSDDRWRAVSAALERAGIAFDRLPAVDGRARSPDAFPDYDGIRAMRHMGRGLVGGEVGCYLSHLAAARAFLDTGAPHGLILEDDAAPVPELRRIVERTTDFLDAADPTWRIVNLGHNRQFNRLIRFRIFTPVLKIKVGGRRMCSLERAFWFPIGACGILWSRRGAGEFVAGHDRISAPVDNFLRHWITRAGGGYAFAPRTHPVQHNVSFQSCIDGPTFKVDYARDIGTANQRRERMVPRHPHYIRLKWRSRAADSIIALRRKMTTPSRAPPLIDL